MLPRKIIISILVVVVPLARADDFVQNLLEFVVKDLLGESIQITVPETNHVTNELHVTNQAAPVEIDPSNLISPDEVKQADFRIETGLFFDLNKDPDDCEEEKKEDDCGEGWWFWPFATTNSTETTPKNEEIPMVQVPSNLVLGQAFEDSHGLYSSDNIEDYKNKVLNGSHKALPSEVIQKRRNRTFATRTSSISSSSPLNTTIAYSDLNQTNTTLHNTTNFGNNTKQSSPKKIFTEENEDEVEDEDEEISNAGKLTLDYSILLLILCFIF